MDYEKLDVYQVSLQVVKSVGIIRKGCPGMDRVIRDQICRASICIVLNIAEGTGKRSPADRRRFYEIARGSAMETAAALDVLLVLGHATTVSVEECKSLLRRVKAMLTRMTNVSSQSVSEETALYGNVQEAV